MLSLLQGPSWFYGEGILIECLSAVTLALVAFVGLRHYHFVKERRWLWFSSSFVMLSTAYFGQAMLLLALGSRNLLAIEGGVLRVDIYYNLLPSTLLFIAVIGFRFLLLFGLLTLYYTLKQDSPKIYAFAAYLIAMLMYFSTSTYYVFHLTSLVILLVINNEYIIKYREKKNSVTKLLAWCFGVLAISQIPFILVVLHPLLYVAGEILQLLGFLLLLISIIKVRLHGKKIKA